MALKHPDIYNNVLWKDEPKSQLFGHQKKGNVWHKLNTALQKANLAPTVKHGGGSVML